MKLPRIRLPQIKKSWLVLAIALGIGTLAALIARGFLTGQMAQMEARGKHQTINLVVAKDEIAKGSLLSSANLAVRPIPIEFAHSGAVKPEEFANIDGQVLAYRVKSGEMILWSQMESKKAPTFSARVGVGHRAITVAVDEINSISGMLEPGDLIDLIFTVEQNGKKVIFPLLQTIQVMATGQRSVDDPKNGGRLQFATVTLNVTPAQAQNVVMARETGKLTALLRNPDDKLAIGNARYDLAALFGTPSPNRRNRADGIPVLYGGGANKFSSEALNLERYRASPANFPPGYTAPQLANADAGARSP
jgi:pilus assembly protein CpaB